MSKIPILCIPDNDQEEYILSHAGLSYYQEHVGNANEVNAESFSLWRR